MGYQNDLACISGEYFWTGCVVEVQNCFSNKFDVGPSELCIGTAYVFNFH